MRAADNGLTPRSQRLALRLIASDRTSDSTFPPDRRHDPSPYPILSAPDAIHTLLPAVLQAQLQESKSAPAAVGGTVKTNTSEATARKPISNDWMIISGFIIVNHILALFVLVCYRSVPNGLYVWCGVMAFLGQLGMLRRAASLQDRTRSCSKIFLALIGSIAFQGSAKWWAERHRVHHRYVDTDADPYNSTRGLFYSHVGWLLYKPRYYSKLHTINTDDLKYDPVVRWQSRWLGVLYIVFGFWLPAFIGSRYGDGIAGFLWVGVMARMIAWHGMWSVNSFAHYFGAKPYQSSISATNNYLVALISHGEGNHNFHHEYPKDYRHGVQWYECDVSKWCIAGWEAIGLARRLHRTDQNSISQSMLQMWEHNLRSQRNQLKWGPDVSSLPVLTIDEYRDAVRQCSDGVAASKQWIKISDLVVDISHFQDKHPGGAGILRSQIGLDATALFFGGANLHTNGSFNLLRYYAVARIV